jgi:hypothetical protein
MEVDTGIIVRVIERLDVAVVVVGGAVGVCGPLIANASVPAASAMVINANGIPIAATL